MIEKTEAVKQVRFFSLQSFGKLLSYNINNIQFVEFRDDKRAIEIVIHSGIKSTIDFDSEKNYQDNKQFIQNKLDS